MGEGKSVKWPVGVGGKGNEGVAGVLSNTPGAIGYVNQAYVKGKLKAAALQNRAGKFVMPTRASGAAALNNIKLDANLAGEDPNPAGADQLPHLHPHLDPGLPEGQRCQGRRIRKAMIYLLGPAPRARPTTSAMCPSRASSTRPRRLWQGSAAEPARGGRALDPGRGANLPLLIVAPLSSYPCLNQGTTSPLPESPVLLHTVLGIQRASLHGIHAIP